VSSPTSASNRIETLDLVRGIAICGLVPINGIEFGFGSTELIYPLGFSEIDRVVWMLVMGLGCGKFATLFAALFGAGMILFCDRAEVAGRPAASIYLPRLGWLFVFGMLHAYLVWHGDILVTYAVTGFVLFWCRRWSATVFLVVGCALMVTFVVPLIVGAVICHFVDFSRVVDDWGEMREAIRSEAEKEGAAFTGGWTEQMKTRAFYAFFTQVLGIPFYLFWFAGMMMCFGMALMKSGFFDGGWSAARLRMTNAFLLGLGLPLSVGADAVNNFVDPSPVPLVWGYTALFAGMPLVAFGYAGLAVMWSRRGRPGVLRRGFAAVGRMALTNYIAQSLVLGFIYYGHGLGLRARLDFYEAMLIAPAFWTVQMAVSVWWLGRFQFGPLEWLWRRLTYGSISSSERRMPPSIP